MVRRIRALRCSVVPLADGYRAFVGIVSPERVAQAVIDTGCVVSILPRELLDPALPVEEIRSGSTIIAGGRFEYTLARLTLTLCDIKGTGAYDVELKAKILDALIDFVGEEQPEVPPIIGLHAFLPYAELLIESGNENGQNPHCWLTITANALQ